eukprot:3135335-Rhodomonas_salina.3
MQLPVSADRGSLCSAVGWSMLHCTCKSLPTVSFQTQGAWHPLPQLSSRALSCGCMRECAYVCSALCTPVWNKSIPEAEVELDRPRDSTLEPPPSDATLCECTHHIHSHVSVTSHPLNSDDFTSTFGCCRNVSVITSQGRPPSFFEKEFLLVDENLVAPRQSSVVSFV